MSTSGTRRIQAHKTLSWGGGLRKCLNCCWSVDVAMQDGPLSTSARILKVSAASNPKSVAGSIAHTCRLGVSKHHLIRFIACFKNESKQAVAMFNLGFKQEPPIIAAVGAASANQAIKVSLFAFLPWLSTLACLNSFLILPNKQHTVLGPCNRKTISIE